MFGRDILIYIASLLVLCKPTPLDCHLALFSYLSRRQVCCITLVCWPRLTPTMPDPIMQAQRHMFPVEVTLGAPGFRAGEKILRMNVGRAVTELKTCTASILKLSIHLSGPDIPSQDLSALFSIPMPDLKELHLQATPPAEPDYDHYFLHSTVDHYSNPLLGGTFIPPPPFLYDDFLNGLYMMCALEHLVIRHFLHIPIIIPDAIPPAFPGPHVFKDLKTCTVQDLPNRIKFFTAYFVIGSTTKAHLCASYGDRPLEVDILHEMLPPLHPLYKRSITALHMATHLTVKVTSKGSFLVGTFGAEGKVPEGQDPEGHLALYAGASHAELSTHDARTEFLQLLLHKVRDIFNVDSLTCLRIFGDVASIRGPEAWVGLIGSLYQLDTLHIDNAPASVQGPVTALNAILQAGILNRYTGCSVPICPRLTTVRISEIPYSKSGIDDLCTSLAWRKRVGRPIRNCIVACRKEPDVLWAEIKQMAEELLTVVEERVMIQDLNTDALVNVGHSSQRKLDARHRHRLV